MNITSLLYVLAAVGLASSAVIHTPPQDFLENNPNKTIRPNTYFAVFKSEAGTADAQRDHDRFQQQVKALGINIKPRQQFTTLMNGVSFEMADADLQRLASIDAVKEVFPMVSVTPPRFISHDVKNPQLKFAHGITGVQTVHDQLGLTGKGIKVGVIDSGIDYMHPALGGGFGKGFRVAYGHDFVGDDYTGQNTPVPDEDPRDCNDGKGGGHGTHVAGIIGAKDKDFVGVAPEVTLGSYRVFGCKSSTATDIIIAAMERAYKDGMDVINLSLGGGSSWSGYPDAVAADKLAEKGLIVVAAMGNDGDKGMWEAGSPAMATKGFAVASFDNVRYMAYGATIDGANYEFDYAPSKENTKVEVQHAEIVSVKSGNDDLGCKPITADVKGKLALIQRGDCTFAIKAKNAQDAGAIGAVIYNKEFGAITPGVDDTSVTIPVVGITQAAGLKLGESIAKGKTTLSFSADKKAYDNPTGGKLSGFSSWGPGPELELKPDVGAPGGLILSTWPLAMGGYNTISGTSMATPYTAGSIALYLQKHGKTNPLTVRDIFKVTAQPATELGTDDLTPVFKQGGGLVQVKDAVLTTTTLSPSMLPILANDFKTGKLKPITITNTGKYTQRYIITHKPALAVQAWDQASGELLPKPAYKRTGVKVDISTKELVLRPGQSDKVNVFFSAPSNLSADERWLLSGYIYVTPKPTSDDLVNGFFKAAPALSIPYGGMHGDYKSLSVLTRPESGLPALFSPATGKPSSAGDVFSLKGLDMPYLIIRLVHPCKHLKVRVVDAQGKDVGSVAGADAQYLGRNDNSEENLSIPVPWDGTYAKDGAKDPQPAETAKDGKYKLKVMALRPFGDEKNPTSWQTWTSPEFAIDRSKGVESTDQKAEAEQIVNAFVKSKIPSAVRRVRSTDAEVLPQQFKFVVANE